MRRIALLLPLLAGLTRPAHAQSARVSVSVALDRPDARTGAQKPIIYLRGLLDDGRWTEALDNSLPIVLTHRIEIWRAREGWIDELVSESEWQTIVTKEPLQEEYAVTLVLGSRPQRPVRFVERDSAVAYLQRPNLVEVGPTRPGRYYYRLTTRVTALSDQDMDQLERFLAGDPDLDIPDRSGTAVGRGVRRLLLRIAGLPSEVLNARSEVFTVAKDEED